MGNKFIEEGLSVEFPSALPIEKLDQCEKGREIPQGMKFVDFVIEEEKKTIFIEFKDPSNPRAPSKSAEEYIGNYKDSIAKNWVPKARDSWCYLHLMKQGKAPYYYIVLIWDDRFPIDNALLGTMNQFLRNKLNKEAEKQWEIKYIDTSMIIPLSRFDEFADRLPFSKPVRTSATETE